MRRLSHASNDLTYRLTSGANLPARLMARLGQLVIRDRYQELRNGRRGVLDVRSDFSMPVYI